MPAVFFFKPTAEIIHLFLGISHEDGAFLMSFKLGSNTIHCAEGGNGYKLTFGRSKLVAGEDITKEVRLHVIVGLWTKGIVPRCTTFITGLHLRSELQCLLSIIPNGGSPEWLSFVICYPYGLTFFENTLQGV